MSRPRNGSHLGGATFQPVGRKSGERSTGTARGATPSNSRIRQQQRGRQPRQSGGRTGGQTGGHTGGQSRRRSRQRQETLQDPRLHREQSRKFRAGGSDRDVPSFLGRRPRRKPKHHSELPGPIWPAGEIRLISRRACGMTGHGRRSTSKRIRVELRKINDAWDYGVKVGGRF